MNKWSLGQTLEISLPTFYSTPPRARDLPGMRWVSSLAFASSASTFLKTTSRKGLKEPHHLILTIQMHVCHHSDECVIQMCVTFGRAKEENGIESLLYRG